MHRQGLQLRIRENRAIRTPEAEGLEMDTMLKSKQKKKEEEEFPRYWRVSPGTRIPDCQWMDEIIQMAMNTMPDNFPEFLKNGVCELLIDRNNGSITPIPCTRGQPGVHVTDRPSSQQRFNINTGSPIESLEQESPQKKPEWVFAWENGHLINPDDYFHCRIFWYYTANGNMLERSYPNELDGPPPGRTQILYIAVVQEVRVDGFEPTDKRFPRLRRFDITLDLNAIDQARMR